MKKILYFVFSMVCCWQTVCLSAEVVVTDQAGRKVSIPQPVNRVVTTFIPASLFALCADLSDALVGASNKDGTASIYEALVDPDHPPVLVGNRSVGLSLETIFSLKPDLVIMYGQKDGIRLADHLTKMGVPAIVIVPETMTGVKQSLDLIGRASGRTKHTDAVISAMEAIEARLTHTLKQRPRKKVYYAGSRLLTTVSGDMLQHEMIKIAGGTNVSENTHGFFITVSREQLLSWNPEVIIASDRIARQEKQKLENQEFSALSAVKKGAIFEVPAQTYWDFPSPLAMAGILWMAGCTHPDLFPKDTVQAEINRLYDTIFGKGFSRKHPLVTGSVDQ